LSPGGSSYFTYKQQQQLVPTKFKTGGLHEKHVVATWNLGSHLSIYLDTGKPRKTCIEMAETCVEMAETCVEMTQKPVSRWHYNRRNLKQSSVNPAFPNFLFMISYGCLLKCLQYKTAQHIYNYVSNFHTQEVGN
jgi:hypothetical protein